MRAFIAIAGLALLGWWGFPWVKVHLPPQWNPFTPLNVSDPPGWMMRYKLARLSGDPAACLSVLRQAREQGQVQFRQAPAINGACSVPQPIRITGFGEVGLSSSFLATCPMAVSSVMFVAHSREALQQAGFQSPLKRITHVGSYACRNIYHRQQGRLSEHATAEAWDVTAFTLADGQTLRVGKNWQQPARSAAGLRALWRNGCATFGNALGPDYNAAHASHFHFGMRGAGYCR